MAHEIAKLMLEHADTFMQRAEAVRTAISLGMPLNEIEAYLDWLDARGSAGGRSRKTGTRQKRSPMAKLKTQAVRCDNACGL